MCHAGPRRINSPVLSLSCATPRVTRYMTRCPSAYVTCNVLMLLLPVRPLVVQDSISFSSCVNTIINTDKHLVKNRRHHIAM